MAVKLFSFEDDRDDFLSVVVDAVLGADGFFMANGGGNRLHCVRSRRPFRRRRRFLQLFYSKIQLISLHSTLLHLVTRLIKLIYLLLACCIHTARPRVC